MNAPLRFVNRTVMFARVFLACFLCGLALLTWMLWRDFAALSSFDRRFGAVFVPLAWLLAGFGAWWVWCRQETVELTVTPRHLLVVRGTLVRRRTVEVVPRNIEHVLVRESRDSDGDPYFRAVLKIVGDPGDVVFAEGSDRERVERAVSAVKVMIRRP